MPHGRLVTGAECECLARMCLARPLARNEGLGRGGCPALIPPHTSLSVCTVLHLVVFGESTLVSTGGRNVVVFRVNAVSGSRQIATLHEVDHLARLACRSRRWGCLLRATVSGAGSVAACFAMSAQSQTAGWNLPTLKRLNALLKKNTGKPRVSFLREM